MMRWKMTLSYLPVLASVAKFLQVCREVCVSDITLTKQFSSSGSTHPWGLLGVELDANVAESGVKDDLVCGHRLAGRVALLAFVALDHAE